jgi:DNA-binding MarR family transcriptional regulator/N-acetylglutamate synthase-like GNAT family acetyltransferase
MPVARVEDPSVAAVRRFNRLYTQRIGVLREGHLDSPLSLAEVRVLYEIAHREQPTAADIRRALALDAGYLSRILRRFQTQRLVTRRPAPNDRREALLALTPSGHRLFGTLDTRANTEMRQMLETLAPGARRELVGAMERAERAILGAEEPAPVVIRPPRVGDLGWIVHRHGVLYAQEYGWDERFEALVAEIVARFVKELKPERERCWVAERGGEIVGSVFLVEHTRTVGKLRLLYVEPSARGAGIGRRLVDECLAFARAAGYRHVMLWTNSVLHAARRIYERAGFRLVEEKPHRDFGPRLIGQIWRARLTRPALSDREQRTGNRDHGRRN